ncbi:MAG TPA: phosphoglycerate dehydrogenase [Polyangiaceae bacterium]|jgi:D-3-phosphoglycerate dehydrogenase|nr:phosphoglycerate dehydrogenase [Polyangiaceae bacterium]
MTPSKKLRALLLEGIHPGARTILAAEGIEVTALDKSPPKAELPELVKGYDLVGIRSKTQMTKAVLESAGDLLTIGCFCIGTNQVDLVSANAHGVPVFNAPLSNTRSVAELVIAEIVMLARQLGDRLQEVHTGRWMKKAVGCHEIRGKTLGIVGYGHIGSQVGVLAESMGMRVVFYDVVTKLPMGNNRPMQTLEELLSQSDFVTLHVPETPQTKNMIGASELAAMKPGSHLMNLSRGTVVVIDQLASAIRSGHLAGAAIDVYPEEPEGNGEGFESDLRGLPNVILTPHIGGSTEEAQEAIGREVATSLARFLTRGTTTGAVNFPPVDQPLAAGKHRILNVHRNVPGVLGDINHIVSESKANIFAQVLATDRAVGYLVMDLDQEVSAEVTERIAALPTSIRTRMLEER